MASQLQCKRCADATILAQEHNTVETGCGGKKNATVVRIVGTLATSLRSETIIVLMQHSTQKELERGGEEEDEFIYLCIYLFYLAVKFCLGKPLPHDSTHF